MLKLEGMSQEMGPPELYPSEASDIVLLGWGSTYGVIKEAVDLMNGEGLRTRMLHFSEVHPFPLKDLSNKMMDNAKVFAVENNYTGQFADIFSQETGLSISHRILKYDGRPFSPLDIVTHVKERM
jgi:2-oxoglutarate ferredoxin oxidoreductase subunit alpha